MTGPSLAIARACFTFDNLGEADDIGAARLPTDFRPVDDSHPSLAVGLPAILGLLDRHGVRASFFVEGWNGTHHPDAVRSIVAAGHDVGTHGWVHEPWSALDPRTEHELAARATDAIADATGIAPTGFRSPGGSRTSATESILLDLGYHYDASLGDGMRAHRLPAGLANVPFVWPGVDGFYALRDQPVAPAEVRDSWLASLDKVAMTGGLFLLVCHPFLTGCDPARLAVLNDVIAAAVSDPRLEVVTTAAVAASLDET